MGGDGASVKRKVPCPLFFFPFSSSTFAYDAANRLTQTTDSLNRLSTIVYDAAGNAQAVIDAKGNRGTFAYDARNRLTQAQDPLGNLATVLFDSAGNLLATVDPRGNRTTFAYDPAGQLTQITDALNNRATLLYDKAGNTTGTIDPLGHRATVAYDARNRATTLSDALNHTTTLAYDAVDSVTAVTNPRGFITSLAYDGLNRLTQSTDALTNRATLVYDAVSNLLAVVDPRGNRTSFAYDVLNRRTQTTDALNHTSTLAYDAASNVTKVVDALGYATTIAYDARNRQTTVTEPTGGLLTTAYDAVGNVTTVTDALNHTTTMAFDAVRRLTASTDARGAATTVVYDAASNPLALVDPVGNRTTYAYDAVDRTTQETDPLGKNATLAYDAAGRLTSQTDRLGRREDLTYDNADRLMGQNWINGGSTVNLFTYTYDNADNLLTAANYAGAYTLAYDAVDRATAMQEPFGMALTYSYDAASNRTLMQDSQGGVLTSVYDAVNRLSSRQFGGASQTPVRIDLAYSTRDQVTGITRYSDLAGNTKVGESAYTYDAAGLLTNLQHKNGSSTVLANYTYTYDLAHRVVTETYNGTAKNFSYDNTDQLTNDGTNAYSFDGNGNRTMTGFVTGTGNRTTNDGTWTYTYDDQGNLTKKSKGASAETITYTYDNANRLLGMTDRSTDGGSLLSLATYVYDALSNRLEKDVNAGGTTTVTRFAYDDVGNAWADLNGSSSLTTRRVYLDDTDSVAARISGSTLSFYLPDRLGSIRNQTDSAGVLSNTITYDGFGKVTSETSTSNGDRFKFTGRELDSETGFQFHHARYYDPATGRWTTADPSGFTAGDPNLYRYGKNNATNRTDPTGLEDRDSYYDPATGTWKTLPRLRPGDSGTPRRPDCTKPPPPRPHEANVLPTDPSSPWYDTGYGRDIREKLKNGWRPEQLPTPAQYLALTHRYTGDWTPGMIRAAEQANEDYKKRIEELDREAALKRREDYERQRDRARLQSALRGMSANDKILEAMKRAFQVPRLREQLGASIDQLLTRETLSKMLITANLILGGEILFHIFGLPLAVFQDIILAGTAGALAFSLASKFLEFKQLAENAQTPEDLERAANVLASALADIPVDVGLYILTWGTVRVGRWAWRTADIGSKLDYLFGRATGTQHNIDRSLDMLRQMERIGLPDTPQNRSFMARFFENVLNDPTNIVQTQANGRVLRQTLLMGPRGGVLVESIWEGDRLITFTIIGG